VATLLAIAQEVRNEPQPEQSIRFGFWGAEEFGDVGSGVYVERLSADEIGRISAYLNLDMVGSPNAARFVYDDALAAAGSEQLTAALLAELEELGAPAETFDVGASSDHFSFGQAGIPTGGVFSGLAPLTEGQARLFGGEAGLPADPCYHLPCDTRQNIKMSAAVTLGQAVANVLTDLAY
jgi:Zn-dependent M28 family amino/carboxypeptidase